LRLAVLDTSVIVSAGINLDGSPAKLVMDWVLEGAVQVVTCPAIVDEYRQVMHRGKFGRFAFPPLWLEFLIEESMHLPDPAPRPHQGPDPEDLVFLALASQTGAWLVTGNLRHFPPSVRGETVVLSPADYLAHLLKSANPAP